MNLPALERPLPDGELAIVLDRAACVLETEGRKAVGASVFGAGGRIMMTAAALHRAADVLLAKTPVVSARDHQAFADACESLSALGAFLWWESEPLECYRVALKGHSRLFEWRRDRNGTGAGENNEEESDE